MRALKIIGIILLVLILLFLLIGIFLPSDVEVGVKKTVNAPAKTIFKQVNTMKNWAKWTPFNEDEPEMEVTYEGIGEGAIQAWVSDDDSGTLRIIESIPYEKIVTDIVFEVGGKVNGHWNFMQAGDSTNVTWKVKFFDLPYPFGRYLGLFINGMMEPYMEKGLNNLKELSESLPPYPEVEEVEVEAKTALVIKDTVSMKEMEQKMGYIFGKLIQFMNSKRMKPAGPPFTLYYDWTPDESFLAAGFPINKKCKGSGEIEAIVIEPTKAAKVVYVGPYDDMMIAYETLEEYVEEFDKTMSGAPWEEYITDPVKEPDSSKWITYIYFPIE